MRRIFLMQMESVLVFLLAKYSALNSSASKVVSSGGSVTLELTSNASLSALMLKDASHAFVCPLLYSHFLNCGFVAILHHFLYRLLISLWKRLVFVHSITLIGCPADLLRNSVVIRWQKIGVTVSGTVLLTATMRPAVRAPLPLNSPARIFLSLPPATA